MKYVLVEFKTHYDHCCVAVFELTVLDNEEEAEEKLQKLADSGIRSENPEFYGGYSYEGGCIVKDYDAFLVATQIEDYEIPLFDRGELDDALNVFYDNDYNED